MNNVVLSGNLGKEPEMRYTGEGKAVTTFSIAVKRPTSGEAATDWFNIVTWEKLAENCNQYLVKGQAVIVRGRLQNRSWEGQDGQKKYRTEIIAAEVEFGAKPNGNGSAKAGNGNSRRRDDDYDPDEIPF